MLYLGYVNGPTEGVIIGCVLIAMAGLFGPQTFHQPLWQAFPSLALPHWCQKYALKHFIVPLVAGGALGILIPGSLFTVYKACRAKGTSFRTALGELTFMVLSTAAAGAWLWSPATCARTQHFILFHVTVGLAFGKLATKIILAHLTKHEFPYYTGLMLPLLSGAVLFNVLPLVVAAAPVRHQMERVFLWAYLSIALVGYGNWIYHVLRSFCAFLDINCLTIKHKKKGITVDVFDGKRNTASPYRTRAKAS